MGAAIPRTGDLSQYGGHFERQAKFALQFVNEGTERFKIQYEDTQTAPNTGVSAAKKLINQKGLPMVFAGLSSGVAMAIAKSVAIPTNTLMATGGTSSKISKLKDDDYVFRASPPTHYQARALATVVNNSEASNVAVIYLNNDFGSAIANEFKKSYKKRGGAVTSMVGYAPGKSSYKSQLNEAMSNNPDGIVFVAYPKSFVKMAKEAFQMGIKDKVNYFAPETIKGAQVQEQLPAKTINGMRGTQPSPPDNRETYQQFVKDNKEEFNREPIVWEAYYFDSVMLCALAASAVDNYESKPLREAVYPLSRPEGTTYTYRNIGEAISALEDGKDINYQGVSGTVNLDDTGDVPGTYRSWEVVDGSFKLRDYVDTNA